jgi:lysophospholipase L1-like esterase
VQASIRFVVGAGVVALLACGDSLGADDDGSTGTDDDTSAGSATMPTASNTNPSDPTSATTPTATDPDGSDDVDDSGPSDSGDESSTTGEPTEPAVHWIGRFDSPDGTVRRFGWSGVGLVVRFDGTGASVTMDDSAGWWTVVVDGQVQAPLTTSPGEQSYTLATGLPAGEHTIEVYRRTEGSFGPSIIGEVALEGELLPPPAVTRRMEVIGDSITCGYGNEGPDKFCNFSADTENHYLAYGPVAARLVGAEIVTVAWSGKGVVNNYGDDTFEPLPQIYDRTLASDPGIAWDFSWQPDVVVINLGTNDFSTDGDPAEDVFVPAYVDFLAHLRDVYPDALILPIAPLLGGEELTMVEGYIQSAIDMRAAAGDTNLAFANVNVDPIGWGCDYHPSVATHEAMAELLADELAMLLGW